MCVPRVSVCDVIKSKITRSVMSLRPNARTEVRRNRYKVAVDADEGRRRREDNMVEIRKNKREENLLKKRQVLSSSQGVNGGGVLAQPSTVEKKVDFV